MVTSVPIDGDNLVSSIAVFSGYSAAASEVVADSPERFLAFILALFVFLAWQISSFSCVIDEGLLGFSEEEIQLFQRLNEWFIKPIFVRHPLLSPMSLNAFDFHGAVFLVRQGSSLQRLLSASDFRAFGIAFSEQLEAAVNAKWRFFDVKERERVASQHDSETFYDCAEVLPELKPKCSVLGGGNMVCVHFEDIKPVSANGNIFRSTFKNLDKTLLLVGDRAGGMLSFIKLFDVPLKFDIEFLGNLVSYYLADDATKVVQVGLLFLLVKGGMSEKSSPLRCRLAGLAVLLNIGSLFWTVLSGMPDLEYRICAIAVCSFFLLFPKIFE